MLCGISIAVQRELLHRSYIAGRITSLNSGTSEAVGSLDMVQLLMLVDGVDMERSTIQVGGKI